MRYDTAWLTIALLLVVAPARASAIVIDDFSTGPIKLIRDGQPVAISQPELDSQHVVGGARHFLLGEFGADGQFVEIDDGLLTLGFENATTGLAYLELTYGSEGEPLALDLTLGNNDRFLVNGLVGQPPAGWLRVGSPGGAESVRALRHLSDSPYLLFSDFTGSADFSNVSWIRLDAVRSAGFTFGAIRTVPEPTPRGIVTVTGLILFPAACRKRTSSCSSKGIRKEMTR